MGTRPKLGILAGGGLLPVEIVKACQKSGRDFFVIAFAGQADPGAFDDVPHAWVRLGAAGKSIAHLKANACKELVMAGAVTRPPLWALFPDSLTIRFFIRSRSSILGDDGFLKALIGMLEDEEGFKIVGADSLLPALLATKGVYGKVKPDQQAMDDIEVATGAALDIGARDIGQGAVAQLGEVLAVEDALGTDALLKLAGKLGSGGPGGVLVKVKKPAQERRVDLPTIGVATVELAARAGLRGIAVDAGGAIVLDRDAVIKAADAAGLFVVGVDLKEWMRRTGRSTVAGGNGGGPLVFIVAGEPSGDLLGARLASALRKGHPGPISFAGVGGARMEEQGIKSLFPMSELSVMGAAEVLPRLTTILARIGETAAAIERMRPAVAVTIDSPDFNFRVGKRLKGKGIPLVHYVAPSVWAWRPGRAEKIAGFLDHLMTLLPFEPPYFQAEGLATTFVGHPVVEGGANSGDGRAFRRRHGIAAEETLIAVLPGSRVGEVTRLHDIFGETLFLLMKKHPENLRVVVPTVDAVAGLVRDAVARWPVPTLVVENEKEKFDAFAASDVALAASGTVALELAMAGTPAVVTYRINPVSAWIARRLIKVRFAHLVNLILDREVVPEFIQESCRPDFLAAALEDLLGDAQRREKQKEGYAEALKQLGHGGPPPSSRAAKVVLAVMAKAGAGQSA